MNTPDLLQVVAYHQASKHHFHAYAPGPGYLDWATQPDPFRRYEGAPLRPLAQIPPRAGPPYDAGFLAGAVPPAPVDHDSVSQLFFDALALSAWKEYRGSRWALRVNPSSGNLHPTEGYLLCGRLPNISDDPFIAHYRPREHALELRARMEPALWTALTAGLPHSTLLVGLTSVHWREAWKYGERAYRYCQHDVGHALASLVISAVGLGWQARLLDDLGTDQLAKLLGTGRSQDAEPEQPDCLVAVYPQNQMCEATGLAAEAIEGMAGPAWLGKPNLLSSGHVEWDGIEQVAQAARKPPTRGGHAVPETANGPLPEAPTGPSGAALGLRQIIHQRRSAVEMDGQTEIERETFYRILARTLPGAGRYPFSLLPWSAKVHLALFVNRVRGLDPGLYFLVRNSAQETALRAAMKPGFSWDSPPGCPVGLRLYRLLAGDARSAARRVSCGQDIAADGCFSLGMIAEFQGTLERHGAWFYPRLFWECGMIGQVLYLEAEAAGVRATGIGCFFDDPVHTGLLGIQDLAYQSLYHFTVGGPEEDSRLTTLPPYP